MSTSGTTSGGALEPVRLTRDVDGIAIPGGQALVLERGTEAVITQSLGGSYTVHVPAHGGLFRIDGKDADAIGKEAPPPPASAEDPEEEGTGDVEQRAWQQLKTCYDPEIPVNIVDLGLIYGLRVTPEPNGKSRVDVEMTLTAPGCGMGAAIAEDARQKLLRLPGVSSADVQVVWDPPWTPQRISPEGKERLGIH